VLYTNSYVCIYTHSVSLIHAHSLSHTHMLLLFHVRVHSLFLFSVSLALSLALAHACALSHTPCTSAHFLTHSLTPPHTLQEMLLAQSGMLVGQSARLRLLDDKCNGNHAHNDESQHVHAQTAHRYKEASAHFVTASKSRAELYKSSNEDSKVISEQSKSILPMPSPGESTRIKAKR